MERTIGHDKTCRKWSTVLGLFLILCPLGIPWYWANLFVYTESYLIKETRTQTPHGPWMMSSFEVGSVLGLFVSALMVKLVGKRLTTIFGEAVFISGFMWSYFAIQTSALVTNCMMGLLTGLGLYVINGVVMMFTLEWSTYDFGLIHSVIQTGMLAGSIGINQMITMYVNPDNLSPDIEIGSSKYFTQDKVAGCVRPLFLVLSITVVGCYFLGFMLVRDNKDNTPQQSSEMIIDKSVEYASSISALYGSMDKVQFYIVSFERDSQNSINSASNTNIEMSNVQHPSMSPRHLVRLSATYVYCILSLLGGSTYIVMASYSKAYGQFLIQDDHFLTNVSTAILISVTIGRVGWGQMLDRYGLKASFIVHFTGSAISSLGFYFSPHIDQWCYTALTLAFACFGSSIYIIGAFAIVHTFGKTHFLLNYGLVFMPASIIILFSSLIFEYLLSTWGWFSIYASCAGWNLVGLVISVVILPQQRN